MISIYCMNINELTSIEKGDDNDTIGECNLSLISEYDPIWNMNHLPRLIYSSKT